jgi:hypothetical protein
MKEFLSILHAQTVDWDSDSIYYQNVSLCFNDRESGGVAFPAILTYPFFKKKLVWIIEAVPLELVKTGPFSCS